MTKVMLVDLTKCFGCYNCSTQCKDEFVDNEWPPYSKAQPDTGHFWMKVDKAERGTIPLVKLTYAPLPCMHCNNPPCVEAYPEAVYRREDGVVIIDPTEPMDEGIVDSCPYGVIYWNQDLGIGQKCTMCIHLLDRGWKEPRCVKACATEAITFGEYQWLQDTIQEEGYEPLYPELNTLPNVYYKGLPKTFVAGNVYDARADENLEDATVTVRSLRTGEMWATNTDNYGDFWLEDLEPRDLLLVRFEKPGYLPRMQLIYTREDRVLGDLAMWK